MTTLYIENDSTVSVTNLKNTTTSAFVNNATVTFTLKDTAGTTVTGQTFPATMTYVAGSDGDYLVTLQQSLSLVENTGYVGVVTAVSGTLDAKWTINFTAEKRIV
jgi:hypothetical protein